MKVIKAVDVIKGGVKVSSYAEKEWRKEYKANRTTKPDKGLLFAFPREDLDKAQGECGDSEYWEADAVVVGRVPHGHLTMYSDKWDNFWLEFNSNGGEYLLCSRITLRKRLSS